MVDDTLGFLREARASLLEQRDRGGMTKDAARALAVTVTHVDTAILWRQETMRLSAPETNEERA